MSSPLQNNQVSLAPFFCYFGGKWRAAPRYPAPIYNTIVEPFAGAAGYATRYHDRRIILVERNPVIAALWRYLIRVSPAEIRGLPSRVPETVDELKVCEEARSLIGFWLNKGTASPSLRPSKWMRSNVRPNSFWGPTVRERIASQVDAIRHWRVIEGGYEEAPEVTATWFVDPPYQVAGKHYQTKFTDFDGLAQWCRTREGQTIVCEQQGADWLPFEPFERVKSTPGANGKAYSNEVLWTRSSSDVGQGSDPPDLREILSRVLAA